MAQLQELFREKKWSLVTASQSLTHPRYVAHLWQFEDAQDAGMSLLEDKRYAVLKRCCERQSHQIAAWAGVRTWVERSRMDFCNHRAGRVARPRRSTQGGNMARKMHFTAWSTVQPNRLRKPGPNYPADDDLVLVAEDGKSLFGSREPSTRTKSSGLAKREED